MSSTPPAPPVPVTVSITRVVDPGERALMQAWVSAGTQLAERFPGFLGMGWVRPAESSNEWHMLYRFASEEHLDTWEASNERRRWLASATDLVSHRKVERRVGIEGWFDEPVEARVVPPPGTVAVPPRWKQASMIWLAFFPLSLLCQWLLGPLTHDWPLAARVLLVTLIMTPLMTYVVLPRLTTLLHGWLHRAPLQRH